MKLKNNGFGGGGRNTAECSEAHTYWEKKKRKKKAQRHYLALAELARTWSEFRHPGMTSPESTSPA